jgi:hypothetical protein
MTFGPVDAPPDTNVRPTSIADRSEPVVEATLIPEYVWLAFV